MEITALKRVVKVSVPACQTPRGEQASSELPWSGDDRADAKTQVFRFVAEKPHSKDLYTSIQEQTHPDKDETDIAITLHHSTLPKLADTDLLDYDPRSKTVRYCGHTEAESA